MLSMLLPVLGAGMASLPVPCRFEEGAAIVLTSSEIRARDLAATGSCPVEVHDDVPLAVLPTGTRTYTMSCSQLAYLVSRRASGAVISCVSQYEPVRFSVAVQRSAGPCFSLTQGAANGDRLTPDILQSADCRPADERRTFAAMDAAGVVALRDLRAGDVIGPVRLPEVPVAEAGDRVHGLATAGPVRIEREFELLQPAWPGRDVFARDRAGEVIVLSVPLGAFEGEAGW